MNKAPEKLGAVGVGSGLLLSIASIGVAYGIISTLSGSTVSDATARSLLVIVVGGGGLAVVIIAVSGFALVSQALSVAASHTDAPTREPTPADATLSGSNAGLMAILASVPGGVIAVDGAQRIVVFNRVAEQIFGRSQAEMLGVDPRQIIPDWQGQVEASQTGHQFGGEMTAHEQGLHTPMVGVRPTGEQFPIEVTIAQAATPGAQFYTAVVRDITRRVQTQEELRQTNQRLRQALDDSQKAQDLIMRQERLRALGQLASGIAHDFNNSLSMIIGFTELLLTTPSLLDEPDTLRSNLHLIHSAAQDAATVVSRLREFSRPTSEGETLPPVQVNDLIAQAISLTQPRWRDQAQAGGRTIRVSTELQQVPRVAAREGDLREVLTNLIINAVDAMPSGGRLLLRSKQIGQRIAIEVSDTGTGMPAEVQAQIFDPFFTTKGEQGTGLGLAMVKGIVVRHGGEIEVESQPGQGTTFRISLPAAAQPVQPEGAASPPAAEPRRAHDLRVLLAEDEASLRQILASYLKIDGHAVEATANGQEALERFRPDDFDLVITDRAMPEMGGDQLAAKIKQVDATTPIIMLTGLGELMNDLGELPPGVDLVIPKPVTLAALRRAVVSVVGE